MAGMNRVLMCRTHPVLEFEYFERAGYVLNVGDIFDESRVPIGMYVDGQPKPDGNAATDWWHSRGIPATRDGLRSVLGAAGIASGSQLLDRSMGLSLSDQYWVRPIDADNLRWEDLNFFHNDFDERLGSALFFGESSRIGDVNTPDVTSAGDLPKRWVITDDGTRTLIKAGRTGQEPDNERIAWQVAQLFGIDHIEYRIGRAKGVRVSTCDEMLSDTQELIPGGQIMHIFRDGTNRERRDIWLEACERLGVSRGAARDATDDFLFLDFLLRNTDRHYNNFGLIRDVETLEARPAPIFDSGTSLWNGMDPEAISNDDYRAKPFWIDDWGDKDNAYWQLSLIDSWDRYDLDRLADVPDIVHEQLSSNQRIPTAIADRIASTLRERATIIRQRRDASIRPVATNGTGLEGPVPPSARAFGISGNDTAPGHPLPKPGDTQTPDTGQANMQGPSIGM